MRASRAAPPATAFPWLAAATADLRAAGARALVMAGEYAPAEVHALCHAINGALGAIGTTVLLTDPVEAEPVDQVASIRDLVDRPERGPGRHAPDPRREPGLRRAPGPRFRPGGPEGCVPRAPLPLRGRDERLLHVAPERGAPAGIVDGRPLLRRNVSIAQPLVEPLYGGKSAHEVLAAVLGQPTAKGGDVVKAAWQKQQPGGFDAFWRKSLHDGVVEGTALAARVLAPRAPAAPATAPAAPAGSSRARLTAGPRRLRRPLREQRLAAGDAEAAHEARVGQRRAPLARRAPRLSA